MAVKEMDSPRINSRRVFRFMFVSESPTMSEKERQRGREFAQTLQSLPEDQLDEGNRIGAERAEAEYKKFSSKFQQGVCYLCDGLITSFDKASPCAHWLLNPTGFKKDNFPAVAKQYGFFQLESYLRWVANEDSLARNINDLKEEGTGKLFESTIRYKELEWGFSCSESDYLGHAATQHARHAHYHFQMRVRGFSFIKYNDFHVAFKDADIHWIEAMRSLPDVIKHHRSFGIGMDDILTDETAEYIINNTVSEGNYDDAPFKLNTVVVADEGTKISSDALHDLIAEAKTKKVPVASLIHRLPNASVRIFVSPGNGVVEQAPRLGGRQKRNIST